MKEKVGNQKYQGDISMLTLEKADKELFFRPFTEKDNGFVIAEGELSGHHHRLALAGPESIAEIAQDENGYFVKVLKGSVKLIHEEHEVQTKGVGLHFFGKQWEYNEIENQKTLD